MGPYADFGLWTGLSIGCLLLGAAAGIYWRVRTGPHPLNDYPSDEAYHAAKAQEARAPSAGEPGHAAGNPAAAGSGSPAPAS